MPRSILPAVLVAAALLATAPAALARPQAKILQVAPASGTHITVTLLVKDRQSRDLDLLLEYKVKGVKGWFPATVEGGLSGLTSHPDGVQTPILWNAYQDVGSVHLRKVRLRTSVLNVKGKKRKSKRFEIVTYGEISGSDLAAAVRADLGEDGDLDDFVLIDTRASLSYEQGCVPGAINLSATDIEENGLSALPYPLDTPLVFYCYGGL